MSTPFLLYATCPSSKGIAPGDYLARVAEVARWSEGAGCTGILVYSDNSLADPWLVAMQVMQATSRLRPLVALQPAYAHPFTVAQSIATLAGWFGRGVDLNLIAGGFKNDLLALGDATPHDERYARLEEYARLVVGILDAAAAGRAFSAEGRWHAVDKLRLGLPFDAAWRPRLLISGSSESGMAAARALDAVAIQYPLPADDYSGAPAADGARVGLRVGMIARASAGRAWEEAEQRFPKDRRGEIAHQMAMKVSDSVWHQRLSTLPEGGPGSAYWLRPFQSYQTFCPYLVGSFAEVAGELRRYRDAGFTTLVLDVPASEQEFDAILGVLAEAAAG